MHSNLHSARDRSAMLMTSTRLVVCMSIKHRWLAVLVGTVDGRGYNDQQKYAICDTRGPCQTIQSAFKLVFYDFD